VVTDADAPATEQAAETEKKEEGEGSTEDAQAYLDSASELKDKLAQLQELISARGEKGDPDLNAKLEGLSKQLEGLGLDGLGGGVGQSRELTEFLSGCVSMSIRKAGIQRSGTISALKKVANKEIDLAGAAELELWKYVGVCVNDLTDGELADYKRGDLRELPKAMVTAAQQEGAQEKVTSIDANVWKELQTIAKAMLDDLAGNKEQPPTMIGALFAIPLIGIFAFLAKKFMDMQNKDTTKPKDKKKNK